MDRDVTVSTTPDGRHCVLLRDVSDETRVEILDWCERMYFEGDRPSITAYETRHGKWTMRGSFVGDDSEKNAALFRMFWN